MQSCIITVYLIIDSCLFFKVHVDIRLWECFIRILIRSLNLKFSMSGLICSAEAVDCPGGNKLIEPNLNTHYEFDNWHLVVTHIFLYISVKKLFCLTLILYSKYCFLVRTAHKSREHGASH